MKQIATRDDKDLLALEEPQIEDQQPGDEQVCSLMYVAWCTQ